MIDLQALVGSWWDAALREAREAVLFLDESSAATSRWHGGIKSVLNAGVSEIKQFSTFERGGASDSRALFIIGEDLTNDNVQCTLKSILNSSCFESCTIVTAMPIRSTAERTSQQQIQWLQRELRHWMGSVEGTVSKILYIPLVLSCVLKNVAVLTPFDTFFPPLLAEESPGQLPTEQRVVLDQIVRTMSALLDHLALRDQLFSVGKFSYTVADELERLPHTAKRRNALASDTKKVSMIFVDRSLDIVLPLSYQKDSLLDTLRSSLPAFDSTDVAIDMTPVCHANCESLSSGYTVGPGTLSCLPVSKRDKLHSLKYNLITAHLKDECNSLAESFDLTDQLEPDDNPLQFVRKNLKVFRKSKAIRQRPRNVVELVGLVQLLSSDEFERRSEKFAVEKVFMQNATGNVLCGALDAGDAVVQLLQARDKAQLSFTELVGFIFYLHSLSGEELYIDQRSRETIRTELLNALTDETLNDSSRWSPLTKLLVPSLRATETELHAAVQKIELAASRVSKQRANLKHYRNVLRKGDLTSPAKYKPLLREIFEDMKVGVESSDLEEHSSHLDGLEMLRGGLGFLMNVKRSRANPLTDADVVVLVALGGITFAEIRMLEDVLAESNVQLFSYYTHMGVLSNLCCKVVELQHEYRPVELFLQLLVMTTSLLTPKETVLKVVSALFD